MIYQGHADQAYGSVTYAQHGDDIQLVNLFALMGIDKPSFLDCGSHHPINISNTYLLYTRGSRGLCVDANSQMLAQWKEYRPYDRTLCTGVGAVSGFGTFYMYDDFSGRNTFSEVELDACKEIMPSPRKHIQLPMMTLNQIVTECCYGKWPNLLSCDLEGLDHDVLQSTVLMEGNRPDVIIVEVRRNESRNMMTMMAAKGYAIYCRMGENQIYVPGSRLGDVL